MRSETFDRKIILQRATIVQDETGQPIETWSDFSEVWASWRRASARETLAASEVAAAITDVFECRFDTGWADLNAKDRLIFAGDTYAIVTVDEIGRREGLRITAVARSD